MYGNHSSHTSGFQNSDLGSGGYPYFTAGHHHHHHYHQHQRQTTVVSSTASVNCGPSQPQQHQQHPNATHLANSSHNVSAPGSNSGNSSTGSTSTNNTTTTSSSNNNNSTPSSAPNNCSNAPPANVHQASYTHTSHLYSPSAIEYGITTSSSPTTDLYFESGDSQSGIYYGPGGQTAPTVPFQENRIISADNGLSYTNLDYAMYHQAQAQDCVEGTTPYLAHHDTKLHLHRYGPSPFSAISTPTHTITIIITFHIRTIQLLPEWLLAEIVRVLLELVGDILSFTRTLLFSISSNNSIPHSSSRQGSVIPVFRRHRHC
ncbi:hypothetical protein ZHAS_00014242 [Anopheles sinensis]|uniref:Uncharacterized protein n=1 Tax=Anopheles sinensis TaxID=74873 RepID=A0A084W808_ANOSI|nr:hypothetical protein ZHAS_00014242 [Anopheles sinensis]